MNNTEIAGKLLREAANFYRAVGQGNPDIKTQLEQSAVAYEHAADNLEIDPLGVPEWSEAE